MKSKRRHRERKKTTKSLRVKEKRMVVFPKMTLRESRSCLMNKRMRSSSWKSK